MTDDKASTDKVSAAGKGQAGKAGTAGTTRTSTKQTSTKQAAAKQTGSSASKQPRKPAVHGASTVAASRLLQRVIFPRDTDPLDVRPLYLDEPSNVHTRVVSRRSVRVPVSARVSFESYFNAFPASYWKRWTRLDEVVLRIAVRGSGRVDMYRSKPNGDRVHVGGEAVHSEKQWSTLELPVSLAPFGDGGWIWFDVFTEDHEIEVADAAWTVNEPLPAKKVAIGTTTFNRVDDCVDTLFAIGEDPMVLDVIDKVFVADQGTTKVTDHPRFAEAEQRLGGRLQVIEQANLGGSGGFARGFYEALVHTDADQILLLDDDIVLEPDSILRSRAFAAVATNPVIVGSQMLNLQARSRLHSMGEVVDLAAFRWDAAPGAVHNHDFATKSLRKTPALHRRVDTTYNGWWMCLFPREVVAEIGLPLPLFIKWDDSEYSLRAAEAGYPTVTLPGSGVWHMPWTEERCQRLDGLLPPPQPVDHGGVAQPARHRYSGADAGGEGRDAAPVLHAVLGGRHGAARHRGLSRRAGHTVRSVADRTAEGQRSRQAVPGCAAEEVRAGVPAADPRLSGRAVDDRATRESGEDRGASLQGACAQPAEAGTGDRPATAAQCSRRQGIVVRARQLRLRDGIHPGRERTGVPAAGPRGIQGARQAGRAELPAPGQGVPPAEAGIPGRARGPQLRRGVAQGVRERVMSGRTAFTRV